MKTFVNIFAACAFILLAASCATTENFEEMKTTEATESSKVQKVLLNATNKSDVAYLGLKGGVGEFRIDDITARAVIIYVMSSSCPTCLEAIAGMNALKKLIDESRWRFREGRLRIQEKECLRVSGFCGPGWADSHSPRS